MNKEERVRAALKCEEVDRVPINLWMHSSIADQDPRSLAELQVGIVKKYDYDFVKITPYGLYGVQDWGAKVKVFGKVNQPPVVVEPGIHDVKDWGKLEVIEPTYGAYGKCLQAAQYVSKLVDKDMPYIMTLFDPITTARKLAGDRILSDMKENPVLFKQGLQVITDTTIKFIKANIEAGVSGFFLATQCCNSDFMTEEEFREFGMYFDKQVVDSYKDITYFNVGHLHGDHGMFRLYDELPFAALSWHDRWSTPSLAEARKITSKCLVGGIREIPYYDENGKQIRESLLVDGSVQEVVEHVHEAIDEVSGRGLIIGPGCCADQCATETNMYALRSAVEGYMGK